MAEKIKLTPAMLAQHSAELSGISNSYKSSLKNVDKILKDVNSHWSKALANNFGTKITQTTKMTSALTDTLDTTVSVISTIGNKFENLDKELSKVVNGEEIKKEISGAAEHYKNELANIYEEYEKLPKEWQEFADIVLKNLTGGEATKALKLILKLSDGKFKVKDIWDVADVVGSTLFSGIGGSKFGLTHFGVLFTTVKTLFTGGHWKKFNYYDRMMNNGTLEGFFRGFAGQVVQEGKLLVDTSCKLIDGVFKFSEINTALKIMYKVDLGKGFNNYTKVVNSYWDGIVSGKIFTGKGAKKFFKQALSIFDKNNYIVKR